MISHQKISAWLHVGSGLCIMVVLSVALAFMATYYGTSPIPSGVKASLATVGLAVGTALSVIAGIELVGGVAFLTGKSFGRGLLLFSSALQLVNLPFGTALGVYTFWALLRGPLEQPSSGQG